MTKEQDSFTWKCMQCGREHKDAPHELSRMELSIANVWHGDRFKVEHVGDVCHLCWKNLLFEKVCLPHVLEDPRNAREIVRLLIQSLDKADAERFLIEALEDFQAPSTV